MVTVIGLGFVGLTTALGLSEYGHQVYGIDIDKSRSGLIAAGQLPFSEPDLQAVLSRHLDKNFAVTDSWEEAVSNSEAIFYCVGTPYGENSQADLTSLFSAIDRTITAIHDDRFRAFVIKSTVPPSTAKDLVLPHIAENYPTHSACIGVANNPEFLREGHCWEDFIHADRIVIGTNDAQSERILEKLYQPSGIPIRHVSLNTAEFIKYLSNTSLACLISFANEMSLAADAIGDVDIADAFHIVHMDKRWQTGSIRSYLYPGCGYGGYCLPKDTNAFYALAKSKGIECGILKNVIDTNDAMPTTTAQRIADAAPDQNTVVGILGLSFNPGSDDVRDTPAAKIIRELNLRGYQNIIAYDPIAVEPFRRSYPLLSCRYANSYSQLCDQADVFALVTAWDCFKDIQRRSDKPVIDCRYMLF